MVANKLYRKPKFYFVYFLHVSCGVGVKLSTTLPIILSQTIPLIPNGPSFIKQRLPYQATPPLSSNASLIKQRLPYQATPPLSSNASLIKQRLPFQATPPFSSNASLFKQRLPFQATPPISNICCPLLSNDSSPLNRPISLTNPSPLI